MAEWLRLWTVIRTSRLSRTHEESLSMVWGKPVGQNWKLYVTDLYEWAGRTESAWRWLACLLLACCCCSWVHHVQACHQQHRWQCRQPIRIITLCLMVQPAHCMCLAMAASSQLGAAAALAQDDGLVHRMTTALRSSITGLTRRVTEMKALHAPRYLTAGSHYCHVLSFQSCRSAVLHISASFKEFTLKWFVGILVYDLWFAVSLVFKNVISDATALRS